MVVNRKKVSSQPYCGRWRCKWSLGMTCAYLLNTLRNQSCSILNKGPSIIRMETCAQWAQST